MIAYDFACIFDKTKARLFVLIFGLNCVSCRNLINKCFSFKISLNTWGRQDRLLSNPHCDAAFIFLLPMWNADRALCSELLAIKGTLALLGMP